MPVGRLDGALFGSEFLLCLQFKIAEVWMMIVSHLCLNSLLFIQMKLQGLFLQRRSRLSTPFCGRFLW